MDNDFAEGSVMIDEHLHILRASVIGWNEWRKTNPSVHPDFIGADLRSQELKNADLTGVDLTQADLNEADLRCADLSGATLCRAEIQKGNLYQATLDDADLSEADLSNADAVAVSFSRARLRGARLWKSNFRGSNLSSADLRDADFRKADLTEADLRGADMRAADLTDGILRGANLSNSNCSFAIFQGADLTRANFSDADLHSANLQFATLIESNLESANIAGCSIYGISAWSVHLKDAVQSGLVITRPDETTFQVDDLQIAQFIYLFLENVRIQEVIETLTSKVVLILGRFTPPERKAVLEALRSALRNRGYLPVLFDFPPPSTRTTIETVCALAHMARFVIADLTDARSVLQELQAIVPVNPRLTVQTLILASQVLPGMFDFFQSYPWCLGPVKYNDTGTQLAILDTSVIVPIEQEMARQREGHP